MSYAKIKELREKRAAALASARKVSDAAEAAGRDLNTEERAAYDAAITDITSLGARADRLEAEMGIEASLRESAGRQAEAEPPAKPGADPGQRSENPEAELRLKAYRRYLSGGSATLTPEERAATVGTDVEGGFIAVPQTVVNALLQAVDDAMPLSQAITTYRLGNAESLGVVSMDVDTEDGDWTAEIAQIKEGAAPQFGRREFKPGQLAKLVKLGQKLMRSSVLPIENLLNARLAYKFGLTFEKAFLTGDGNKKPLGLFVASNDGIPTSRDVSTGNTATAFTVDGLIEALYSLKAQYQAKAKWLLHRASIAKLAKLADTTGQKLWQPSIQVGQPDLLLGKPLMMSEHAPSTFTASSYVGAVGDFSFYWSAISQDFQIQRLNELYAATSQVGFIGRADADGMPVLAEAFARIQLAAS